MINAGPCCRCKCEVWIPDALYEAAQHSRGPNGVQFYCSYGHSQHYVWGESELEKMRRERDRLTQRLAEKDDDIRQQRERREAAERRAAIPEPAIVCDRSSRDGGLKTSRTKSGGDAAVRRLLSEIDGGFVPFADA